MKSALLVIADPATKLRLLRILGRHGWWVDTVASVEGALGFLEERRPRDITLVDWDIEGGSGMALLQAIKLHSVWGPIPVVMMHESVEWSELERAFALGANEFLPKPFTETDVIIRFDRWVIDHSGQTGRGHTWYEASP